MSYLDSLDSSLISSDLRSKPRKKKEENKPLVPKKTTKKSSGDYFDSLDSSIISSDLKTSKKKTPPVEVAPKKEEEINHKILDNYFGGNSWDLKESKSQEKSETKSSKSEAQKKGNILGFLSRNTPPSPILSPSPVVDLQTQIAQLDNLTKEEKRAKYKNTSLASLNIFRYFAKKYYEAKQIPTWTEESKKLTNPKESNAKKFAYDPILNSKIAVWQGDIASLEIDAIVSPANESLITSGNGIDSKILKAAGPHLEKESSTLGGCKPGEAKITRGWNLPAKYVIHSVIPIDENTEKFQQCFHSSLNFVASHSLRTIAFTHLSFGRYGFPLLPASRIALKSIRKWLEAETNKEKIDLIIFCLENKEEFSAYFNAAQSYFPTSEISQKIPEAQVKQEEKHNININNTNNNNNITPEVKVENSKENSAEISEAPPQKIEEISVAPQSEVSAAPAEISEKIPEAEPPVAALEPENSKENSEEKISQVAQVSAAPPEKSVEISAPVIPEEEKKPENSTEISKEKELQQNQEIILEKFPRLEISPENSNLNANHKRTTASVSMEPENSTENSNSPKLKRRKSVTFDERENIIENSTENSNSAAGWATLVGVGLVVLAGSAFVATRLLRRG